MPALSAARVTLVPLLVGAIAFGAAACGKTEGTGDSPANRESGGTAIGGGGGGEEVAASDAADILNARRTINARCPAGGSGGAALQKPVSTIVRIMRVEGPDKVYEVGSGDRAQRLGVVAKDLVKQLDGCGAQDQAERVQRVAG